jgi:DNA-directed RNA polymerase specialized sigma subunit
MEKIRYDFVDGTSCEIEVDSTLYIVHKEIVQQEKRNHWKETRRHISLTYLNKHKIDIEAPNSNPLPELIVQEDEKEFEALLSSILRPKQMELLKMVWDGMTVTEIARNEGVLQSAISHRLKTILKKLKVFSEKPHNLPFPVLIGRGNYSAYYKLRGMRK